MVSANAEPFLKDTELAEVLRLNVSTVRDMARANQLPFIAVGKRRRFLISQIVDHLTQAPVTKTEVIENENLGSIPPDSSTCFEA